jgi:hypothetical protein
VQGEPLSRAQKVKRNIFRKRLNLVEGRDYNQIPVIAGQAKVTIQRLPNGDSPFTQNSEVPVAGHPAG